MKTTKLKGLLCVVLTFSLASIYNNAYSQCNCSTEIFPSSAGVKPGSTTATLGNSGTTNPSGYKWHRDGNFVQACACATYVASKPGEYILTSDCPSDEYSAISNVYTDVPTSPTPSTTANLNSVTTGATNTVYYLTSDVDFLSIGSSSLTFTNCTFIFQSGVKMNIPEFYASLIPLDVEFNYCGFYGEAGAEWDGVDIDGGNGGGDIEFNNCHFRMANFAIHQDGDRAVTVDECEFGKNGVHIAIENVTTSGPTSNMIQNNQFGNLWEDAITYTADNPYNLGTTRLYTHLWLSNCGGIIMYNNTHVETKIDAAGYDAYGIYAEDCDDLYIGNSTMDGSFLHGIHLDDNNVSCDISYNDFNYNPLYTRGGSGACSETPYPVYSGIYSFGSDILGINDNNFVGCVYGTEVYSENSTNSTYLTKNSYIENSYGLVLASHVNPIDNSSGNSNTISQNTTFYCNDFSSNYECGVAGWGTVITQGASGSGAGADASNRFVNNIEWNLLIDHGGAPGTPMGYYYNETGSTSGDYDYSFSLVNNGANVTLYGNSSPVSSVNQLTSDENSSTGCYPTLKKGWSTTSVDEVNTEQDRVIVYPNPFSNYVEVNVLEANNDSYVIKIIDVTGKVLLTQEMSSNQTRINTEKLVSGIYFLQVLDTDNNLMQYQKLIKAE